VGPERDRVREAACVRIGYLVRKHGPATDDLLAAEVVTADGRLLGVEAETGSDLFWAIRGGGNFGVATRFQFRLHELDRMGGRGVTSGSRAKETPTLRKSSRTLGRHDDVRAGLRRPPRSVRA
jgi:FAD/FMN-containing dehydrogenase